MKTPSIPHRKVVELAISLERKSKEYQEIKASLPCIVFTFLHDKIVRGNTVVEPTGYIYLDVDDEEIDERLYSNPYVHALWKTLSGKGYAILVKVKGVNKDNLKAVTKAIAETLDIPYDSKAVSIDRLHVVGFDSDIYYNKESTEFKFKESVTNLTIFNNKKSIRIVRESTKNKKLRFNNFEEIVEGLNLDFNGEASLDMKDNKIPYYEVWIPDIIHSGGRNATMHAILVGIYLLNSWMEEDELYYLAQYINRKKVRPTLEDSELNNIVKNAIKDKDLKLIPNRQRRIVFNPDYDMSGKERRAEVNKQIGKARKEDNNKKLLEIINKWDFSKKKLTVSKLAEIAELGRETVQRRKEIILILKKRNEESKSK